MITYDHLERALCACFELSTPDALPWPEAGHTVYGANSQSAGFTYSGATRSTPGYSVHAHSAMHEAVIVRVTEATAGLRLMVISVLL